MTAPFRSVLLTPNVLGADGVSCLSRQIAPVLPEPVIVLSLHDDPVHPIDSGTRRHSAGGHRLRFIALAHRLCSCPSRAGGAPDGLARRAGDVCPLRN